MSIVKKMVENNSPMAVESVLQVIAATDNNAEAIKLLTPAIKDDVRWHVTDVQQLRALTDLIIQRVPQEIYIFLEKELEDGDTRNLVDLLSVMNQTFTGILLMSLNHSHIHLQAIDEKIVAELSNSK